MSEAKMLNRVLAIIMIIVALWFVNAGLSTLRASMDIESHPDVQHQYVEVDR